jgi:hypothetical protein
MNIKGKRLLKSVIACRGKFTRRPISANTESDRQSKCSVSDIVKIIKIEWRHELENWHEASHIKRSMRQNGKPWTVIPVRSVKSPTRQKRHQRISNKDR